MPATSSKSSAQTFTLPSTSSCSGLREAKGIVKGGTATAVSLARENKESRPGRNPDGSLLMGTQVSHFSRAYASAACAAARRATGTR